MIEFLDKWQTLIGSILGGIFALLVAFIVGYMARRREEVSSAMIIAGDLANIRILFESLTELAKKQNVPQDDFPYWVSEKLAHSFPNISSLFESSLARMLPINKYLAAHLTIFHKLYREAELTISRITDDIKLLHKQGKPDRPNEYLKADARIATNYFNSAIEHAKCSQQLIEALVLSKMHPINKLMLLVRETLDCLKQNERECIKLLKSEDS